MLKSIQNRETGKDNLKKKLNKINRLENRLADVRHNLDEEEVTLLALENEEVNMYDDYLNNQYINTENVPAQVLMLADRTIPLYDEQEAIINELEQLREEIRRIIPERIIRELDEQE